MTAVVIAIINLVIIILKAYFSGAVDRLDLIKKVQEAQDQIDKMSQEETGEMRLENRNADSGLEAMQEEMDQELKKHDSHK